MEPRGVRSGEFTASASSAPDARHFAMAAAAQLPVSDECVDTLALVASELATNAILHARTPFQVAVSPAPDGVRVEVADRSPALPSVRHYSRDASTGRGLSLVGSVSQQWGFDLAMTGKVVWAEVAARPVPSGYKPPRVKLSTAAVAAAAAGSKAVTVRFLGVPVATYLALQQHNDEVLRDLELLRLESARRDPAEVDLPPHVLNVVERLTGEFGQSRDQLREAVEEAHAAGLDVIDLDNHLPPRAAVAAAEYVDLLEQVDVFCREERILARPAPADVAALRRWFVAEMHRQIVDGMPPAPAG